MALIACVFFLIALWCKFSPIASYKSPVWKKILGWSLICLAFINAGADGLAIYEKHKIYKIQEALDVKGIKSSLGNLKKCPNINDLTNEQRNSWRREQIINRMLYLDDALETEEALYFNQQFVKIYGKELARQMTYDQRQAIMEDSIARWNGNHINETFKTYLYPYSINSTHDTIVDNNKLIYWEEYSKQSSINKLSCLRNIVAKYELTLNENFEDYLHTHLSWSVIIFTILLGWGVFVIISKPMNYKLWKYIIISLLYIFITIALLFCTQQDLFVRVGALVVVFTLMVIILFLNLSNWGIKTPMITSHAVLAIDENGYSEKAKIYAEEVKNIDSLTNSERQILEQLRIALQITPEQAQEIEKMVIPEITEAEKQYLETYISCIGDKCKLSKTERRLLNRLRDSLGISYSRAKVLEKINKQDQRFL